MDRVTLAGFDFGSTTTSMLVATARLASTCATGRMEFTDPQIVFRPPAVFTPFEGAHLRLDAIAALLDGWLAESGLKLADIFSGGAIVTGLAARQDNAGGLRDLVVAKIGDAIVATADDPRLEAWLAFMGSAASVSRNGHKRLVLNLDIGGGTTNPALGRDGLVSATGSVFIGARHIRFVPGSYRIAGLSEFGEAILAHHGISARSGETLEPPAVAAVVATQIEGLEALVTGNRGFYDTPLGRGLEQSEFSPPELIDPIVTFSGGVGELVYAAAAGAPLPPPTHFGDLGVDLARAILASERLSRDVKTFVPETRGRATVQGLTLHATEISGTTLYLSSPELLPLRHLPVVAALGLVAGDADIAAAIRLAQRAVAGAAIQVMTDEALPNAAMLRRFGTALGTALAKAQAPANAKGHRGPPLVVLTDANVGKALGNYASRWGGEPLNLVVIDEVPMRRAHFVNLGRLRHGVVPVSFYGMS